MTMTARHAQPGPPRHDPTEPQRVAISIEATVEVPGDYGHEEGRDPASEVEARLVWYVADDDRPVRATTLGTRIAVYPVRRKARKASTAVIDLDLALGYLDAALVHAHDVGAAREAGTAKRLIEETTELHRRLRERDARSQP
jgi:hypothetical protein